MPTRATAAVADAETGEPVEDVTSSPEAWMHLLATRDDLGTSAHVHPEPTGKAGEPAVGVTCPTTGRYIVDTELRQQGQLSDVHQRPARRRFSDAATGRPIDDLQPFLALPATSWS